MIAIDTNVLVRALTDDSSAPKQTTLAIKLIKQAGQVYVPQIVQVEFIWVLQQAYKLPKSSLVSALETLLNDNVYILQGEVVFRDALDRFKNSNAGFADSLIVVESQSENSELWTFDRKLSKQGGAVHLTEQVLANAS